jgi:hypothetical protein
MRLRRPALPLELWFALGLAFCLRFAAALFVPRVIKWDEPDYLRLGYNLLHGAGFTAGLHPEAHYTPLYPIVSGLSYLLVHDWEWASNLPYILCGTALLLPVYALACRLYDRQTATIAVLLLACFPPLVTGVLFWGTMTEPLYLLLIYTALWSTWRSLQFGEERRRSLASVTLAGVCFGLAYLSRPEAITYLAISALGLFVWQLPALNPDNPLPYPRFFANVFSQLSALLLSFMLVALPYLIYLHSVTGQWTLTGKLGITWALGQAVVDADPAEYDRVTASLDSEGREIVWFSPDRFQTSLSTLILADPAAFVRRVASNLRRWQELFFARTAYSHWFLLVLGVALWQAPWDRRRLRHELFLGAALLPVASFLLFHVELRFFSPIFPILLIWSAFGLVQVAGWANLTWRQLRPLSTGLETSNEAGAPGLALQPAPRWYWLVTLPVCLLLFTMNIFSAREGIQATKYGHKEAGLWLRANTPTAAAIMTRDLAVPLYAERPWVASPHASWPDFLAYARAHHADYLVVDRWELTEVRPHLAFLLENPPPEVQLVWQQADPAESTFIFRFRRE